MSRPDLLRIVFNVWLAAALSQLCRSGLALIHFFSIVIADVIADHKKIIWGKAVDRESGVKSG